MLVREPFRVGYVVKRYPRYSETFIVREILAHERAGLVIEIYSMRPGNDTHFQDLIARVRAPVRRLYLSADGLRPDGLSTSSLPAAQFWKRLAETAEVLPQTWSFVEEMRDEEVRDVYQALLLARETHLRNIGHLHAPFASDVATVARLAARLAGISFSFTARAKDIFHESVEPADLRQKLRDASGVITISDFHLAWLQQTFGALADGVQRIYNGLDLDEYPFTSPHARSPRIVAIGRLVEKKGFGDLIEACALLAGGQKRFHCRIIGAGVLDAELRAQIERLGLHEQVELAGPLPQMEVIREIQAAAVLAAPCVVAGDGDRDGLPNVIQEALALGTPVISTDVTGIPEVIRDGETGLQVPQRNPQALAVALERLLVDSDLRVDLASAGRRLMEAEFDIYANAARRRAIFMAPGPVAEPILQETA
jgi:glycosyltransferase involved in cell wall biosynthesis